MAQLVSPGVSVTVSDESFYAGASEGTVPLIVIATKENKANPDDSDFSLSTNIAPGTVPSDAGTLKLITSQRELIQTYGEPFFNSIGGTPIHGDEINEFGLLAASQYLSIADRAFVVRADIPMQELAATSVEPITDPADGTYWLDTTLTKFGVFQSNGTVWNAVIPSLLDLDVATGVDTDASGLGDDGDFAIDIGNNLLGLFEKISGTWNRVGSAAWVAAKAGSPTLTYAPHTGIPPNNTIPAQGAGNVWIKTTNPDGGADYIVKLFSASTAIFTAVTAPVLENDAAANTFYTTPVVGNLYVDYEPDDSGDPGTHIIKRYNGTAWVNLTYTVSLTAPTASAVEGTLWYDAVSKVDIMVNDNATWTGYINKFPSTDPAGPILNASEPTVQTDGTALVEEDIWVDTNDLENYPLIYVRKSSAWVLVDNADQTTDDGIVFADAREITTTLFGLTSNAVDSDAPDPLLFPTGTLLWNHRFSTLNVKKRRLAYTVADVLIGDRWVSESGNKTDGSPFMGRKAQRKVITVAMAAVLVGNEEIRSEFRFYNLIATPGYCELMDEMITLNTDIKEIAFIIGDTPIRLASDGTSITNYATGIDSSVNGNSEEGRSAAVNNAYVGQWYPWGLSTNIDGTSVMIPPSALALRTIAFSDNTSFPWFAPAGFQRGLVTNAQSVGFLNSEGEFTRAILNEGQRDTLQTNKINPISDQPNRGLVHFGQKTLSPVASALDRVNVARLINFIRFELDKLMKSYLFEPNDAETRESVAVSVERFLADILGKRGITDFGVRCDDSNNTPARIDANELWCDVAIIPTKSVEFIYIPIRILNTGDSTA